MKKKYPLTQEEFKAIYTKVPRLTVEVIVRSDDGILLTKRAIYPGIGEWHIPGGTVYYNEPIAAAVKRIAKEEVGLDVDGFEVLGMIEYPTLDKENYGDPRGLAVLITEFDGQVQIDDEASEYGWFTEVPEPFLAHQSEFLVDKALLKRA